MSANRPVGDPGIDAQVGRNIRAARHAAGLRIEDLAARMGIHPTTITYWEIGKTRVRVSGLFAVAAALEMDPRDLLPESGSPQ